MAAINRPVVDMTARLGERSNIVNKYVDKVSTVDKVQYVDRKVIVEKPKIKKVIKYVDKIVYVDRPVVQERIVKVEVPFFVDKIVETPMEKIVEVPETYEVKREVERKVERVVEEPVPVDMPKVVERKIEKLVEEAVPVPVDREVTKEVVVDKVEWKDTPNYVDRVVVVGTKVETKKVYHDKYYNSGMGPRVVVVADDPETRRGGNVSSGQAAVHLPGDADMRERVLWEEPVQDKGAYRAVGDMPKDAFGGVKYTTYEALPKDPRGESALSKDATVLAVGTSVTGALELAAALPAGALPSPKVLKDETKDMPTVDPEVEKKLNSLPQAPSTHTAPLNAYNAPRPVSFGGPYGGSFGGPSPFGPSFGAQPGFRAPPQFGASLGSFNRPFGMGGMPPQFGRSF